MIATDDKPVAYCRYPAPCVACDEPMEIGQLLTRDEYGFWIHLHHAEETVEPDLTPIAKVCPVHFIELPLTGQCDDCE